MPLSLHCQDLTVTIGETTLLTETSFEVTDPGIIALTGANGAGKTTLLKTLAGRQLPSWGEVLINDRTPYEFDPTFRAEVASLIDTPPMARDMTLLEQLALVRASWGQSPQESFQSAEQTLQRLTIPGLAERFPYELSAGQLQLFAIGLTISRPYRILLLDEPERHLDTERVQTLLQILRAEAQAGSIILTATHRQEIVEGAGDQIHLSAA